MPAKKKAAKKEKPFEDVLEELGGVVVQRRQGDVPLEESLAAFERGVGLAKNLQARLDAVQEKIEELTRSERGEPSSKPLEQG